MMRHARPTMISSSSSSDEGGGSSSSMSSIDDDDIWRHGNARVPKTMAEWNNRALSLTFADNKTLVWDTDEGSGIITKYGIGKLPPKHAEAVISMLLWNIETLTKQKAKSLSKKRQRAT